MPCSIPSHANRLHNKESWPTLAPATVTLQPCEHICGYCPPQKGRLKDGSTSSALKRHLRNCLKRNKHVTLTLDDFVPAAGLRGGRPRRTLGDEVIDSDQEEEASIAATTNSKTNTATSPPSTPHAEAPAETAAETAAENAQPAPRRPRSSKQTSLKLNTVTSPPSNPHAEAPAETAAENAQQAPRRPRSFKQTSLKRKTRSVKEKTPEQLDSRPSPSPSPLSPPPESLSESPAPSPPPKKRRTRASAPLTKGVRRSGRGKK